MSFYFLLDITSAYVNGLRLCSLRSLSSFSFVFSPPCTMLLFFCFVAVVALYTLVKYVQYRQHVKSIPIPGPPPAPFLGNVLQIAGKRSIWLAALDWHNKYGNIMQIFLLRRRFVIIGPHEETVKDIHANPVYIKGILSKNFWDGSKTGLLFSDGEIWSRARRACAGAFNVQHLQIFSEPLRSCIKILSDYLETKISTVDKLQTLDMDEVFMLTTLDMIGQTMFSVELKSMEHGESPLSKAIETYLKEAFTQMNNPLQHWNPRVTSRRKKAIEYILGFMDNVIELRIKSKAEKPAETEMHDLLDLLLDARDPDTGVAFTRDEIRDQVMTFLFAGHETTAHSLTFALSQIAQNPHVAKQLYEELDAVVSKCPQGIVGYADVSKLPYLTAVIKETMRMFPVVASIVRQLDEDHQIGTYTLPKGTLVAANVIAMHYNPKVWKEPTVFDPTRFLRSEDSDSPVSTTNYMPFGHGRRTCIGQNFAMVEMKMILASILYKFKFQMIPLEPMSLAQHLTFRPKGGLQMTVWKR